MYVHHILGYHVLSLIQKASILGFPKHSAFVLDMRMAKDPARVATFLAELRDKLQGLKKEEMDLFLSYKKEDVRIGFRVILCHITSASFHR